ncbi:MAG: AAA family ATPase [Eubacterium sp.]|nr:AAA family ATPase [Eubacterium sp.]
MRLLSLHVENFGTLSDFDMDFNEGTNVILRENGWGKSTLAEFVRVMFYGIEGSRKKEYLDNDRTRFQPWNGKYFGGEMSFEARGKRYKVERYFGDKDKDMTFKLYDLNTLLETHDYSENLGEELFGVDSESFRRTCFVGMDGLKYQGINSTIGAKVSSLDQTGDLENYDAADKRMTDYLNAFSPRKKTGELNKIGNEINELKEKLKNKDSVIKRIDDLKSNRIREEEAASVLKTQQDELLEIQKKRAAAENLSLRMDNLRVLRKDVEERRGNLERRLESLPEEIPTHDMISEADRKLQAYSDMTVKIKNLDEQNDGGRYSRLESFFAAGTPDMSEIDSVIESWNGVQNLMQKNETLEALIQGEEERFEADTQAYEERRNAKSSGNGFLPVIVFFVISAACFAGFVFTKLMLLTLFGSVSCLVGLAVLLIKLTGGKEKAPIKAPDGSQIQRYKQDIQANNNDIKNMEGVVKAFLARYEIPYSRLDAESVLYDIKSKAGALVELRKESTLQENQKQELEEKLKMTFSELEENLGRMGIGTDRNVGLNLSLIKSSLADLARNVNAYEHEVSELQKAENRLKEYMDKNPEVNESELEKLRTEVSTGGDNIEGMTAEAISVKLRELSEILSGKQDMISRYDRELETAYEEIDDISESEERLAGLMTEKEELTEKYETVLKTQEYLKEAKEIFIAKYMSPIKDSFEKYYSIISGDKDNFRIDANVNLARKEEGAFHDIQAQSEGYGDAIGISMRLALLDTMYEKEKPVIILDDPFSGMDEKKLEGTGRLLDEVSREYQIIYMTCHDSRTFKGE